MTETIQRKINDSAFARWTALVLIASTMFFGYMFVDVLSPLKNLLETSRGWNSTVFGLYGGSEFILNVCGFLIVAGIILDKMGVRFTGLLSASLMVAGAAVKTYGISEYFCQGGFGFEFFSSFLTDIPASAKLACLGFMIFGCGTEMAGITVSKAIVKWFTGKEMALAMGLEMAIARLGVFAVFSLSPWVAELGSPSVVRPVAVVGVLLCIGLLTFLVFTVMDRKLDRQTGAAAAAGEPEEQFKVSDLRRLFTSGTFLTVAALCVLYIGVDGMLAGENTLVAILSISIGAILGELLQLDEHMHQLGDWVEQKFGGKGSKTSLSDGFVTASLLFCVGAMAIMGALDSGLTGDHSTLYAKALLDGIISVVYASTLGIGVALSAIPIFLYQGAIALGASFLAPYLTEAVILEMKCVGSILILGLSLNMLGLTKIKVINYVPAVFLPILLCRFL